MKVQEIANMIYRRLEVTNAVIKIFALIMPPPPRHSQAA